MAAVTDLPFRTICEEHGVGLTITEFLSARALCEGAKKTTQKDDGFTGWATVRGVRSSVELDALGQSGVACHDLGAALVDINMGCPPSAWSRAPLGRR